jgi:hypothetical protein
MAIWEDYDGELEIWLPVRPPNDRIVRVRAAEHTLDRSGQEARDNSKTALLSAADATMNVVGSGRK